MTDAPPGYRADGHLHSDGSTRPVVRTDFDVDKYVRGARGRIHVSASGPVISGRAARDLAFLWRLEVAALAEMRSLLTSWTGNETRITAFLATWAYERYWLARAARDLLTAAGRPLQANGRRPLSARIRSYGIDRFLPLVSPVVGGVLGEPLAAGHVARMAVQEGALRAGLAAVRARLEGEASDAVGEIIARRTDFVDFFRAETRARVERSTAERASAVVMLSRPWAPLRAVGVADAAEVQALSSIFDTPAALADLEASDLAVGAILPGRPTPALDLVLRARRRRRAAPERNTHGL
ncbi:hypothetical protein [Pseudactinotalea suaedae]|uniref:hypothetical protein n=1 Tax=Pseudactinotalea suaedae TaxID=1524924 RepID=UPI0012E2227F|nr:hypothetical protein [Pseudactinotalea suaedae]